MQEKVFASESENKCMRKSSMLLNSTNSNTSIIFNTICEEIKPFLARALWILGSYCKVQRLASFRLLRWTLCFFQGIRLFVVNKATDDLEWRAFSHQRNYIDIYSNSWGPGDTGIEVIGPGPLAKRALKSGAEEVNECFLIFIAAGDKRNPQS